MTVEILNEDKIIEGLVKIFEGYVIPEAYPWQYRCRKCRKQYSSWKELDPHHVTYKPNLVKYLCHKCHVRITYLNMCEARLLRRKLTSKDRMKVWKEFLKEKTTEADYKESEHGTRKWFSGRT